MMTARNAMTALATLTVLAAGLTTAADAQERSRRNRGGDAEAAATPPAPTVSRAFQTAYGPLQTAVNAQDWAAADAALVAVKAAASNPYEQYVAARTELSIAIGTSNTPRQNTAMDALIATNSIPAAEASRLLTLGAQLAYNADRHADAAERARLAIAAGSTAPNLPLMRVFSLFASNQVDAGLAYFTEVEAAAAAAGGHASDEMYGVVGRQLQELDRTSELTALLINRANFYPTAGNIRAGVLTILQSSPDDPSLSIDMLRLMFTANAMNDRRFFVEHVSNLGDAGLPNEAVRMIEAGRAANVIPAGDTYFSGIEQTQRDKLADDRASLPAGERRAAAAPDGRLARLIGDAYYGYGEFAKAEEMFRLALGKSPGEADLLNFRIGIARFGAGNHAGALESFGLVQSGPRAPGARLWEGFVRSRMAAAAPAPAPAPAPTPAG